MKRTKPQPPAIPRLKILQKIAEHLSGVIQWTEGRCHFSRAAEYQAQAEALIELLEVADCGSVGGFDEGQIGGNQTLFARFEWLVNKHHSFKSIKFWNGKQLSEVRKFFHPYA